MTDTLAARPAPRRRLQTAARDLFCAAGAHVSTEAIAAAAEVDPALVASHFGSRDALIASALRLGVDAWFAALGEELDRHAGAPQARLLAPFALFEAGVPDRRFYGALLTASIAPATAAGEPVARPVLRELKRRMADLLARLAADAGAEDPVLLAQQLILLFVGLTASELADPTARRTPRARVVAESLLRGALPPAPLVAESLLVAA